MTSNAMFRASKTCEDGNHFWSDPQLWKWNGMTFFVRECLWCGKQRKESVQG